MPVEAPGELFVAVDVAWIGNGLSARTDKGGVRRATPLVFADGSQRYRCCSGRDDFSLADHNQRSVRSIGGDETKRPTTSLSPSKEAL